MSPAGIGPVGEPFPDVRRIAVVRGGPRPRRGASMTSHLSPASPTDPVLADVTERLNA